MFGFNYGFIVNYGIDLIMFITAYKMLRKFDMPCKCVGLMHMLNILDFDTM